MTDTTDHTDVTDPRSDRGRALMRHRRAFSWLTSLMLVAVIGSAAADGIDLVDAWGVDDRWVREVGPEDTQLSVRYPTVSRPALASPFEIVIERPGGFDSDVEVAVDLRYLELWDLNGIHPSPKDERSDDERVVWTFDPPDGDTLRIVYEARIEPGVQLESREGAVSLIEAGESAITVRFETDVRP